MSIDNTATIVRAKHSTQNPYFQMLRATAQDRNLSWEARGVICYLLSKPDDWEIQIKDLEQNCAKGRVYRIIKELIEAGYLEDRVRLRDDKGKISYTPYKLHEKPFKKIIKLDTGEHSQVDDSADEADNQTTDNPLPQKPDTDKPEADEPDTGEPHTDNADVYIKEKEHSTEEHNKENKEEKDKKKGASSSSAPNGSKDNGHAKDDDLAILTGAYEANMGPITPMLREHLADLKDTYTAQWCLDAMAMSLKRGVRKLSYVEGILKNWLREGRTEPKPEQDDPIPVTDTSAPTPPAEMLDPFEETA